MGGMEPAESLLRQDLELAERIDDRRGVADSWAWLSAVYRNTGRGAEAMDAWMNSPGHRDNLLRTGWTHTGIGVHEGAGGSWWTQVFISR